MGGEELKLHQLAHHQLMSQQGPVPEIEFRYETKARKVMVDFKFDALYS